MRQVQLTKLRWLVVGHVGWFDRMIRWVCKFFKHKYYIINHITKNQTRKGEDSGISPEPTFYYIIIYNVSSHVHYNEIVGIHEVTDLLPSSFYSLVHSLPPNFSIKLLPSLSVMCMYVDIIFFFFFL